MNSTHTNIYITVTNIDRDTRRIQIHGDNQANKKDYVLLTWAEWDDVPIDPYIGLMKLAVAWDVIRGDGDHIKRFGKSNYVEHVCPSWSLQTHKQQILNAMAKTRESFSRIIETIRITTLTLDQGKKAVIALVESGKIKISIQPDFLTIHLV